MYQITYDYLRPKKAAALKQLHKRTFKCNYDPKIWCGNNATILPLRYHDESHWTGLGGVIDCNGEYVVLSSTYTFVNGAYPVSDPAYCDQKVVYCGYLVITGDLFW